MSNGSSDLRQFKNFQIRWAERLGQSQCPYLIRWTFIIFGYSIRIHHWLRSDDVRHYHDHASNLLSIVLKGYYWNVSPVSDIYEGDPPNSQVDLSRRETQYLYDKVGYVNCAAKATYAEGLFENIYNLRHPFKKSVWRSSATKLHYLKIPEKGAWTLLFEGKSQQKWGFFVNDHKMRPLRYFSRYGIIQDEKYR
jgi:hypothetical protein